jgi:hypothetical protein
MISVFTTLPSVSPHPSLTPSLDIPKQSSQSYRAIPRIPKTITVQFHKSPHTPNKQAPTYSINQRRRTIISTQTLARLARTLSSVRSSLHVRKSAIPYARHALLEGLHKHRRKMLCRVACMFIFPKGVRREHKVVHKPCSAAGRSPWGRGGWRGTIFV